MENTWIETYKFNHSNIQIKTQRYRNKYVQIFCWNKGGRVAIYLILFINWRKGLNVYSFSILFCIFEYLLDPKYGRITFLFVIYCPLFLSRQQRNNKSSFPTFIKKTPAGRYTAQKSETKRKYQTLKNIIGHGDTGTKYYF